MSYIAIIPARSGSKRIPNKNMRLFSGRPLIEWTIIAALNTKAISQIIITSDHPDVKTLCDQLREGEHNNSESNLTKNMDRLLFLTRPDNLASDTAGMAEVISHVIDEAQLSKEQNIILLQPTSPLRSELHITEAIDCFEQQQHNNLVSVTPISFPPQWCLTVKQQGDLNIPESLFSGKRSQDYQSSFVPNGAIYISNISRFRASKSFYTAPCYPYIMAPEHSQDIDDESDWKLAEALFRLNQ